MPHEAVEPEAAPDDPVARAYMDGFAAGLAAAESEAQERAAIEAQGWTVWWDSAINTGQ